jgi:hypothetical protein
LLTGLAFGGVHAFSAPAVDLVPLAALGFGLCLVYVSTRSLYPCIAAHSINNSIAFGVLEEWPWWQAVALAVGAFVLLWTIVVALRKLGVVNGRGGPAAEAQVVAQAS